jgi:hypothetical protein
MEAIYSSETSVDFQRTTRRYIVEDKTLHELKWLKYMHDSTHKMEVPCIKFNQNLSKNSKYAGWYPFVKWSLE